ncbi:uncharacterized protein LOC122864529 [Siniperca chuatsi]|uniref:uncharacterized protein LOC122864529 n=1 Tax=Siniperca chuatsi TaxID=119488 RepID=UPI001CE1B021|nr:uncharacterized protein LOC122864529 [Siniperca chuatsi]
MWNQPFKQSLQDAYDQWAAGDADKEYTAGGNLKVPARRLLVDWVVAAWDKLDKDMIRQSFKVCGLSVRTDGSEDDLILCFREGQPCAAGREALTQLRQRSRENRCEAAQEEGDEEELLNNEFVVFDDDEEDFEQEDCDHMSLHRFIHQALPSNDKKLIVKEEQQEWSPSLDQDPEPPHIKEEQEELWTSQEGEQLRGLEEADITKFPFTPVPVKSEEDDEEKLQSSQFHQSKTEQMEKERRKFDFKFKERVLQYAETHSAEKTARHFNIDSKRIRDWRKQRGKLLLADKSRARLTGGGRKKVSLELERRLSQWIYSMLDKHNRVSRNMIKKKALEIYPSVSDGGKMFVASTGWLQRFLQRNDLSLRRRTPMSQEETPPTEKLVSFVDYVGKAVSSNRILEGGIIVMDETAVLFNMVSPTAIDTRGAKSVAPKTTRYEDSHLTVVLAAKADGTKLKPYIVFRKAAGEVKALQQQISSAVISTSVNGWMNDALTADWLQSVVGKFNVNPRLLVWDSYRCHTGVATKAELKCGYNVTTAVIPGGCTKYIQPPAVMWNQPFKQSLQDAYDQWAAGDADKEYTAGGNLKVPARRLLVDWVVAAWDKLDKDMIRQSFKVCGLSVRTDGSEDDLILCFREGQPCAAGREALTQLRQRSRENRCEAAQEEEDEEELLNNEFAFLDDDDDEEDFEQENSDHMSLHCFIHQALPSNNKKTIVVKEEQQEWSPSLDQDPEPPHIKEEQEELWTSQEGEQLRGLEEADITKFPFAPVPVKSEEDEEKPQSSRSFIKAKLNRWKQELMERTVEDQDQPGTQIQIHIYNLTLMTRLETLLRLMTVMTGTRPVNLSQV